MGSLSYLDLVQIFRTVYGGLRHAPGFHFLKFYLASPLQDICHWPPPHKDDEDVADPYAVASYLRIVRDSPLEGASDDAAR